MALKLGMLGMWHSHADGLVKQVTAHPEEFSLVGFYDPDPELVAKRRKAWESRVPNFRVFDTPQQVLDLQLDGVVVEGRVFENVELARLALESGRNVMLEKPAGPSLKAHRDLVALAQRKHLHVQMIYLFRYMSAVQEMFRLARQGDLGSVYEFRARLPKDQKLYDDYAEELKHYSGGMFFEMAGHVIDMLVTILGPPNQVTPFLGHHFSRPPESFVDNGVAIFGCKNSWGIIEVPSFEIAPHSRRIEVYGTEGACVIPHMGSGHLANKDVQPIEVFRRGARDWKTNDLPAATLQIADLREFAAIVGGKKEPNVSMEHDLIVQEALLKASGMIDEAPKK
jgi:predicted dehydrogenase